MYVRFFRWATDRLDKNGIIAFISNNSFLDGKAFDGFRKLAAQDFNEIHIINLKGNARNSGERRKQEGGNIFSDEIKVGVAVYFCIRKENTKSCKIYYNEIADYAKSEDKKVYLSENTFQTLSFDKVVPDKQYNWINQSETDFEQLIPLISKDVKAGIDEKAIFKLFTNGIKSKRDEWIYDLSKTNLENKLEYLVKTYNSLIDQNISEANNEIKWSRLLLKLLKKKVKIKIDKELFTEALYRPYFKQNFYFSKQLNDDLHQLERIIDSNKKTLSLILPGLSSSKDFFVISSDILIDLNSMPAGCQCVSLNRYDKNGSPVENITDWGLKQF